MHLDEDDLVTVFRGSLSEALSVQAALGALGFRAHIPAQNTKVIDPFITGANIFEVDLQVPASRAEEAMAAIEEVRVGRPEDGRAPGDEEYGDEESEAEETAGGHEGTRLEPLERIDRRLRWSGVLFLFLGPLVLVSPVTAALGLVGYGLFAIAYTSAVLRADQRPRGWRVTVACLLVPASVCAGALIVWIALLSGVWGP